MRNHNSKIKEKYETQSRNYQSPFLKKSINIDNIMNNLPELYNHGVCGSENLGNTCYMNSSIACLSNCLELTYYFLSKDYTKDINKENKDGLKGQLANSWYNLLKDYWTKNISVGNPNQIKQLISKKTRKFDGYYQQDSNEFMTVFLELLGEDLNAVTKKKYIELKEQSEKETDIEAALRFWQLHLQRNDSIITYLFHGLFKSTVICPKCKCHNITYEPFNTLTLTIPSNNDLKKILKKKNYNNRNKSVNKPKRKPKIKFENFVLFYIPPLSLCQTKKFEITINPIYSLNKIIKEIQNRQNEVKITNPLQFISVINKQCQKYLDSTIPKTDENFIFSYQYELRGNFEYSIPVYLSYGEQKSAYPRMLFFQRNATYAEFKKKIYILVRKYICPFDRKNESEVDKELNKYIEGYSNSLDKVLNSIYKEFEYIDNYSSYQTNDLLHNFPYKIFLQDDFDKPSFPYEISFGKKDNFRLMESFNIKNYDSCINKLLNEIKNFNQFLIIKFNPRSPYLIKEIHLDTCSVVQCQNINDEEDSNKMIIESENNSIYSTRSDDEMDYKNDKISLEDCLQYFTEEESLEKGNEWHCQNCKKPVNASKKIDIFYLPKIMTICLSRFNRKGKRYTKNEENIDFPLENLDMGKYMCGPDKNFLKYDLFAVSQHYGGMGSGHYEAVCKNMDGKWYKYDDSDVSLVRNENEIRNRAAYVLFFRRKDW